MKILIVSPRALNFALAESILMLLLFFFVLCAMPLSTGKTPSMSLWTTDSRVDDLKTEIVDLLTLFGTKLIDDVCFINRYMRAAIYFLYVAGSLAIRALNAYCEYEIEYPYYMLAHITLAIIVTAGTLSFYRFASRFAASPLRVVCVSIRSRYHTRFEF